MAWRRIALLLLLAGIAGCGATTDPAAAVPPRRPRSARPSSFGELKAASWRAAAVAEAQRLRPPACRHPPRARAPRPSPAPSATRCSRERITPREHARLARVYADARAATGRLDGTRAYELGTVLAIVDRLAAEHRLTPSRLRPAFLVVQPQHAVLDPRGDARLRLPHRRSGPIPPSSSTTRVAACSSSRWRAGARSTGSPATACERPCPVKELRRSIRSGCSLSPPTAAASSRGSTTSTGAAARRRGSAA